MKAIVRTEYGTTDVLSLEDVAIPVPGDDEVLVKVHAAGVDRGAYHILTGKPYAMRPFGFGLRRPRFPGLGGDLAGVVEKVGSNVTRFAVGDEVFGIGKGAFAEYAVAPERKLVAKPAGISFEQASTIAISGITALRGLRDSGGVKAGDHVLVIGASGGVGTFTVQIAKAMGAIVTGVAGPSKQDLVRSIGADHVLDHTRQEITDGGHRYDVIMDIGGGRSLSLLRRALTPTGTLVLAGAEGGGAVLGGTGRQLIATIRTLFTRQKLRALLVNENAADIAEVARYIERGDFAPAIDRTFTLPETADALRYMDEGKVRGKVVISI